MPKDLVGDAILAARHFADLARLYLTHPNNEIAYHNFLFSVALASRPRVVLELGTGRRVSSLAFIRSLQYHNRRRRGQPGILHTCDMNPDRIRPLARFGPLVVPHAVRTDELASEWQQNPIPVDLLYIDADHSHEQSLRDFQNFSPYVVPNGLVLMHDTFPLTEGHEQPQYSGGVWMTAKAIKVQHSPEFEIVTVPYLCGISLLRKAGSKYF